VSTPSIPLGTHEERRPRSFIASEPVSVAPTPPLSCRYSSEVQQPTRSPTTPKAPSCLPSPSPGTRSTATPATSRPRRSAPPSCAWPGFTAARCRADQHHNCRLYQRHLLDWRSDAARHGQHMGERPQERRPALPRTPRQSSTASPSPNSASNPTPARCPTRLRRIARCWRSSTPRPACSTSWVLLVPSFSRRCSRCGRTRSPTAAPCSRCSTRSPPTPVTRPPRPRRSIWTPSINSPTRTSAYDTADSAALLTPVVAHVRMLGDVLHTEISSGDRQRVLRNRIRAAILAGRMAFERLNNPMSARAFYSVAHDDARELSDDALRASVLGRTALLAVADGRHIAAMGDLAIARRQMALRGRCQCGTTSHRSDLTTAGKAPSKTTPRPGSPYTPAHRSSQPLSVASTPITLRDRLTHNAGVIQPV
jgi:hypothetical protein